MWRVAKRTFSLCISARYIFRAFARLPHPPPKQTLPALPRKTRHSDRYTLVVSTYHAMRPHIPGEGHPYSRLYSAPFFTSKLAKERKISCIFLRGKNPVTFAFRPTGDYCAPPHAVMIPGDDPSAGFSLPQHTFLRFPRRNPVSRPDSPSADGLPQELRDPGLPYTTIDSTPRLTSPAIAE